MLSPERISVLFAGDEALAPGLASDWLSDLPPARRLQLEALPDAADRSRSLIASRLLLRGLRELLGPDAADLRSLRYGPDGAPQVDLPVHFSLSHCPGRVVCAVSRETAVGVDVEPLDAGPPGRTNLYLIDAERTLAGDDPHRLLWLWTRKEAVAKAAGRRGLRGLGLIDVRSDLADCAGRNWQLVALDLGPGFVAHLACAAPAPPISTRPHSAESLR